MTIDQFLTLLDGVRQSTNGKWQFRCPAHEDKNPSAWCCEGKQGDGAIMVGCATGCTVHDICGALGIRVSDLFPDTYSKRNLSFMERQRAMAKAKAKQTRRQRTEQAIAQAQIAIIAAMDVIDDMAAGRKPTANTRRFLAARSMELLNADAKIRGFDT